MFGRSDGYPRGRDARSIGFSVSMGDPQCNMCLQGEAAQRKFFYNWSAGTEAVVDDVLRAVGAPATTAHDRGPAKRLQRTILWHAMMDARRATMEEQHEARTQLRLRMAADVVEMHHKKSKIDPTM